MSTAAVTVIIVTYQSRATIGATLEALHPAYKQRLLECIVVDNASDDGVYDMVMAKHPWVQLIQSGANLGFARGNNLGLAQAQTPYVLFLNPDATITAEGIRGMLQFLEAHPQVGILGPAIRNERGADQLSYRYPTPKSLLREALGRQPKAYAIHQGSPPYRTDWVSGAVMLVRKALLDQLGGFDPRFFLYFEETDLCYRARQIGYETWTYGAAIADHLPGTSARMTGRLMFRGCIAEHYFRSRFYYLRKHHGLFKAMGVELAEWGLMACRMLWKKAHGNPIGEELSVRLQSPLLKQPVEPRSS